jgi:hypothetical protein
MGSALTQAINSMPTRMAKGDAAADKFMQERMYQPTQPTAYEYAQDVSDFLEKLETKYKIPPVLPEAMALQYLTGPATSQATRAAGRGAEQAGMALERSMAPAVTGALERGGLQRDLLTGLAQGTTSNLDVWHGSPHRFPPTAKNPLGEFDASKMGTGEGAQAYGIGHYTAEAKDVAKTYQPRSPKYEEKLLSLYDKAQRQRNHPMMEVLEDAMLHRDPEEILAKFANTEDGYTPQHIKAAKDFATWYEKNPPEVGGLYKVDLSDEAILKMLDLDKPLSEQSEAVKAVLLNHPDVLEHMAKADEQRMRLNESHPVRLEKIPSASNPYDATRMTGSDVMSAIAQRSGMGERGAVEKQLKELGIPGIKYLDEGSRGATGSGKWQITNKDGTTSIMDFKPNDDVLESMGATASPYGTRNFVVFPGNEDLMNIIDRKKSGGKVSISNNPDTMMLELNNQKMAGGGAIAKLARAAPKSKAEIDAIARRMAPQMLGEFVRGRTGSQSVAEKTQKQFAREKEMVHDIRPTGAERGLPRTVDYEELKDNVMVGIAGDPTISGKTIYSVNGVPLESPSPQHGGPLYGLEHEGDAFWASGLGAANRVQNIAREASKQYELPVLGNYVMMGPDSINYAQHYADANLAAINPAKMSRGQIEDFNKLVRLGSKKSGPRPSFPGIENPSEAYLHFSVDPELRKHFNALMQMPTVTQKYNLPSGVDIRHAVTEPDLRDLEIGVTGKSIGRLRPEIEDLGYSEHPTYSHDIPGEFLGSTKYNIPYELSFPDTVKSVRENPKQAPQEFGSFKYVGPRQVIDQQLIDEIKQYQEMIKKYTGKKKGGAVHKAEGGEITGDDLILEERPL